MRRLKHDTKHVQYVMDLWGKPFTAAGAQSVDGKCTYVLLRLAGDIGQMQANESVDAVRDIIAKDTPPPGLKVYVSGAAPLASDTLAIANASLNNITIVTIFLILVMLLLVYRSRRPPCWCRWLGVLIEMLVAKGVVSTLGHLGYIELSSFAVNIVIALTLGAGTDYGIFLMGRYHEARQAGESREEAFYIAYKGVTPIIIGSGLTIAGRVLLLDFRATQLLPHHGAGRCHHHAVHHRRSADARPGDVDRGQPVRALRPETDGQGASVSADRGERGAVAGADPRGQFRRRHARGDLRADLPAELRRPSVPAAPMRPPIWVSQAADRHFPKSKLFSEMLMVETDHDMRNSADFISLDRVARALIRLPGVAMVQSITRPLGRALEHATIPYLFTTQGSGNGQQLPFNRAAKRQYRRAGTDPDALRRGPAERDRLLPEDVG